MNPKLAVREIMEKKGVGTNALADRLGKPARLVSDRLGMDKSENISTDKLAELLRALDYKIVLVPRETRNGQDWYEVG